MHVPGMKTEVKAVSWESADWFMYEGSALYQLIGDSAHIIRQICSAS